MNALSLTIAHLGSPEKLVRIEWPDTRMSLYQLLTRISAIGVPGNPALKCFSYIVAPQAHLVGLLLVDIDLRGAQMHGANFTACHLINANLEGADLEECIFYRATLEWAELGGASLKKANLEDARINFDTTTKIDFATSAVGPDGKFITSKAPKEILFGETEISEQTLLYADLDYFGARTDLLRKSRAFATHSFPSGERDILARVSEIKKIMKAISPSEPTNVGPVM